MTVRLGRIWTEFDGTRIRDYLSLWVLDIPIILVRRYDFNHDVAVDHGWLVGCLWLSLYWRKDR